MDRYYADSLRELKINKFFTFHVKEHPSEILNLLETQI